MIVRFAAEFSGLLIFRYSFSSVPFDHKGLLRRGKVPLFGSRLALHEVRNREETDDHAEIELFLESVRRFRVGEEDFGGSVRSRVGGAGFSSARSRVGAVERENIFGDRKDYDDHLRLHLHLHPRLRWYHHQHYLFHILFDGGNEIFFEETWNDCASVSDDRKMMHRNETFSIRSRDYVLPTG